MKKIAALFLALMLILSMTVCALAEIPEEKKPVVTELDGVTLSFHTYNSKIYEVPCEQPGTIEKIEYTTDVYGDGVTYHQWANVYLPYGYDESKQYNIIYFFHGTNETQDSFICEDIVKNAVDNMIYYGVCDPFIMVCPTYYYVYEERTVQHQVFPQEVRNSLMPVVESKYSTYAETADEAGFIASREHRAISGYSQGSSACWNNAYQNFDIAKYIIPMSGSSVNNLTAMKEALAQKPEYADDIFIVLCSGGKRDLAYEGTVALANAMLADDQFSFGTDTQENNFFVCVSKELHQTLKGRFLLYNAMLEVVFK